MCTRRCFPVIEKYPIPNASEKDDTPRNKQDVLTHSLYGESPKTSLKKVKILEKLLLLVGVGIVAVVKMPI